MSSLRRIKTEKELEQILIRLVIGFGVLTYMVYLDFHFVANFLKGGFRTIPVGLDLSLFYFISLSILLCALWFRLLQPAAIRFASLVIDMSVLSFAMALITEYVIPMFFLYYWVITGHAFRFGLRDLLISTLLAIIGFSTAVIFGEYWHSHYDYAAWLLLSLVLLPGYIGLFIRREHQYLVQLESEKVKANAANQAKSDFLANVTHELRTPLNGIVAVGDLLLKSDLKGKQTEYAGVVVRSANILRALINNILDYSKLENKVVEAENIPFDLHSVINTVKSILEPVAIEKGIEFNVNLYDSVPGSVLGDHVKLSQILMNLGNNAIKFTDIGYVGINIFPKSIDENKITIRFEIIDTGIGIKKDSLDTIFDRFKQENESITRRFGGTGLGTTISKSLVEVMAGKIGVTSEEGVGSRFWFEIPFEIGVIEHNTTINAVHVIILADNMLNVHDIRTKLESWQYEVDTVTDLKDLISAQQSCHIEIPGTVIVHSNSFTNACRTIERLNETTRKNINFILAGNNLSGTKYNTDHFNNFLALPINTRELYHTLHFRHHDYDSVVTPINAIRKNSGEGKQVCFNILVCDDEKTNRYVMNEMLLTLGHQVSLAENGYEAMDLLQEKKFDLAILDMQMPDISGLEVAELYHYSRPDEKVPLVLATANMNHELPVNSREFFSYFLEKPINLSTLTTLINKFVSDQLPANNPTAQKNSQTSIPLFDHNAFIEDFYSGLNDSNFAEELFQVFIDNIKVVWADMKNAISAHEFDKFKKTIHSMLGIASNVKALQLTALLREIHQIDQIEFANVDSMDNLSKKLLACFNSTEREMRHCLFDIKKNHPKPGK